eukprot:9004141-Prorocentrum_lima.AAC.1
MAPAGSVVPVMGSMTAMSMKYVVEGVVAVTSIQASGVCPWVSGRHRTVGVRVSVMVEWPR